MDTKTLMLTLALFSLFLTFSSKTCNKYDCGNLTGTNCTYETSVPADNSFFYQFKVCADKSQVCNWYSADPVRNPYVNCTAPQVIDTKVYPGQKCGDKVGCFSGNCTNGACPGAAENQTCTGHSQCLTGLSCYNITNGTGTCRKQVNVGGNCTSDFDCVNNAGCGVGSVCVEYFSVPNNGTVVYLPAGDLSFCASGESVATTGNNGTCVNKVNLGASPFACNDTTPCVYNDTFSGKNYTDAGACECSRGPNGAQFCPLGNGQTEYQRYVASYKAYLKRTLDFSCHTVERTSCAAANQGDTNSYNSFYNAQIQATKSHILRDSPDCVKKILYPNLNPPGPAPNATNTCPKVSCGKLDTDTCVNYKFDSVQNQGSFTGQSCASAKHCDVNLDIFTSTNSTTKKCVANEEPTIPNRYPGEKCDAKNTCLFGQTCTDVCGGQIANQTCSRHEDCKVGLYCAITSQNSTNGTNTTGSCTAQAKSGSVCTHDFMCPNNQGCLNGKCTDYYSVPLNTALTGNTATYPSRLCKSGQVVNNTCYGLSTNLAANQTKNKDGLVACNINDANPCQYKDNAGNIVTEACQCSYDPKGQSFCRKGYDESDKNWQNWSNAQRGRLGSTKCHTSHRFQCFDIASNSKTDIYNARIATTEAHSFFYADDCVKKMFNAGEFIKVSIAFLAILVISLF